MALRRRDIVRALLILGAAGCGPPPAEPTRIRVAAASDLQSALPVLASAFRQGHDVEVVPVFGASGQLAEQIRQGAPFDVFLSANREFVESLAGGGAVESDSVRPYARGALALAVNKLSAVRVGSLRDLTRPEVHKIAIANPETAPYGRAARQALERAGLWDVLGPKLVPADSVRQALQLVQTGNAEVGIVGRSMPEAREAILVPLPLDASDPIVQYLGVVAASKHRDEAGLFADFVLSDVGQGILLDLGFRKAVEGPSPGKKRDEPKGVD